MIFVISGELERVLKQWRLDLVQHQFTKCSIEIRFKDLFEIVDVGMHGNNSVGTTIKCILYPSILLGISQK
jgi:hypothetical protein